MANSKALTQPPSHYPSTQPEPRVARSRTHAFSIAWQDSHGEPYNGSFVCHIPTIGDNVEIADRQRLYLEKRGGQDASDEIKNIAVMTSMLAVLLDEKPDWMQRPEDLIYFEPMRLVFEEVTSFIERFHRPAEVAAKGQGKASK